MLKKIIKLFNLNEESQKDNENNRSDNLRKFLLEILSEEIPFSIHDKIYSFIEKELKKIHFIAKNEINISKNRITIEIFDLPNFILSEEKKIKGPKIDSEEKQIVGFCKKYFCEINNLIVENDNYFFIQKANKITIQNLLENFSFEIINLLSDFFKDGVRCVNIQKKWIMPVLNICACLDDEIIDFRIGNLNSNNKTLVNINSKIEEINVNAFNYTEKLKANYILYKKSDRINMLKKASDSVIKFLQKDSDRTIFIKNEQILQEISCIVDFPFPLICKIPRKYFEVINDVLILTLEKNQKYIILSDEKQNILDNFIAICEGPRDFIISESITKGYEAVAINRLQDAYFYQNKDSKIDLVNLISKLEKINFYKNISLRDFVYKYNINLIKKIQNSILQETEIVNYEIVEKLNYICKIDLSTSLFSEFPELQGIIGYHYIKIFWNKDLMISEEKLEDFSQIIKYQYSSIKLYENLIKDNIYKNELLIFNLVLKISTINILWKEEKPTGNGDPFALKRIVDDIFHIMILLSENNIKLNLKHLINEDIYSDFEDYFLNRILKQLIINHSNFKEEDLEGIKNNLKQENLSCNFLKKLAYTMNIKNNSLNKDLFLLEKRLKGYEKYLLNLDLDNQQIFVKESIFNLDDTLNIQDIVNINKWLEEENIIDENDSIKTKNNLSKIKIYLQFLRNKIIL